MSFAPIAGGELFYESAGSGPPLLLVSGLGGVGAFWRLQVRAFADRFTVVSHDHRGTGQSAKTLGGYTVDRMADDVLALMDHLKIDRACFAGHSTGGAIGQRLAVRAPTRIAKLVLSSTWTHCDPFFRRVFESRKDVLRLLGPAAYVRMTSLFLHDPEFVARNDAALAEFERNALAAFPDPEIVVQRIDAICAFDGRADLPRIGCPTLVTCAVDDMVTPVYFSRAIAAAIPGARYVEMAGGGHFAPVARAPEWNRAVEEFLTLG